MNKVVVLIGLLSLGGYMSAQEIKMVEIPAGVFTMGSDGRGEDYDEAPAHLVTISRPFRMSVTEITNAQYEEYDPSHRAMRGYARGLLSVTMKRSLWFLTMMLKPSVAG